MFTRPRIRLPAEFSLDSWARLAVCSRAEGKRISPSCPRFICGPRMTALARGMKP